MFPASPVRPHYVSLAQASVITGLSIRTLRRSIAAKRLRAHRIGRLVRIEIDDLHEMVQGQPGGDAPSAADRP